MKIINAKAFINGEFVSTEVQFDQSGIIAIGNDLPDDEVIDALTDSESVKNMPAYPSSGYCDVIDGHMIIKLQ